MIRYQRGYNLPDTLFPITRLSRSRLVNGRERPIDGAHPAHGHAVVQQLWHAGHNGVPIDGSPPWSSCDLPSPVLGIVPITMSQSQIREMVEAFAAAAERCQRGGIDGVELRSEEHTSELHH